MRILFMGTPDIAAASLAAVLEAGHEVCGVFTREDKPVGRKQILTAPPVKQLALEHNLPVYQPKTLRTEEVQQQIRELAPELIVVVAYGRILPPEVLCVPPKGCINLHVSLLPKYRGAAPIQWCVIDGERETGITTMMMDVGLDTGDMLEKAVIPIEEKETGGSLHDKLSMAGGDLILSTLKKLEEGTLVRTPQTDEGTCYAKMLTKSLGDIDWNQGAVSIERLIRGLNPWPSAYTMWNGKTIKIWAADVIAGREAADFLSESGVPAETETAPGTVVCSDKRGLVVCTGGGLLSIRELQMEGKKRMDTPAFLRGYPIPAGDVFVKKESD